MRTGPIAIAISTAGSSPALAKRMKREIGDLYGPRYAELAGMLNDVRGWAKATLPSYDDRKRFFEGIVNGAPDPIALLRAGDRAAVESTDRARQAEATGRARRRQLLEAVGDPAAGEVVGRELDLHAVARQDPDVVAPHLA